MASSQNKTGLYFSEWKKRAPQGGWSQADVTGRDFLDNLVVLQKLGSGGNGSVYRCTFHGQPYALKLPGEWMEQEHLMLREGRLLCDANFARLSDEHRRGVEALDSEFTVAERVLDPPTLRLNYQRRTHAGTPGHGMSETEYAKMLRELAQMRAHPGHQHLLRLIHFQPEIPCILMEQCAGSAWDLMHQGHFQRDPAARVVFVRHVLLAMEYLCDYALLAQIDHKPDNVLYCHASSSGTIIFKLCDYGLCYFAHERGCLGGTEPYFVPPDLARAADAYTLSCLQLAMMTYMLFLDAPRLAQILHAHSYWNAIVASLRTAPPSRDPLVLVIHAMLKENPTGIRTWYPHLRHAAGLTEPRTRMPFTLEHEPATLHALSHKGYRPPPLQPRRGEAASPRPGTAPPRDGVKRGGRQVMTV